MEIVSGARQTLDNLGNDSILRGLWQPVLDKTARLAEAGLLRNPRWDLPFQASNSLLESPEDLKRFDAFLERIGSRAAAQGATGVECWTDLKGRLCKPGFRTTYRQVVSAGLEVVVLGVLLAKWGGAVELWPELPEADGRSDAVARATVPFNCEVTCCWSDRDLERRGLKSRKPNGSKRIGYDEYYHKLAKAVAGKRMQMRTDMLNVLFMAPLFSEDPRPRLGQGEGPTDDIISRALWGLRRRFGISAMVFDFDGLFNLRRLYVPVARQQDEDAVTHEIGAAFVSHWPGSYKVDVRVLPSLA